MRELTDHRVKPGRDAAGSKDHELADLVWRAQRADALAMDELLQRLEPYVEHLCKPIAMQNAADAAQESMIVIYRNLWQLKEPGALLGWVRIICLREAVRVARLNGRVIWAELTDAPTLSTPQLAAEIQDVLDRLTPDHRAMLTLRHLEELDEQTVAQSLGLPLGTVRSRLYRARKAFRKAWE